MAQKKYLNYTGLKSLWSFIKNEVNDLNTYIESVSTRLKNLKISFGTEIDNLSYEISGVRKNLQLMSGADASEISEVCNLSEVSAAPGVAPAEISGYSRSVVYDTNQKRFVIKFSNASADDVKYYFVFMYSVVPSDITSGGVQTPVKHVTYVDKSTGCAYRWNGSDLTEYAQYANRAVSCDTVFAAHADDCVGETAGVRTFMTDNHTEGMPASASIYGSIVTTTISSVHHIQVFTSFSGHTECWTRRCLSSTWSDWEKKF